MPHLDGFEYDIIAVICYETVLVYNHLFMVTFLCICTLMRFLMACNPLEYINFLSYIIVIYNNWHRNKNLIIINLKQALWSLLYQFTQSDDLLVGADKSKHNFHSMVMSSIPSSSLVTIIMWIPRCVVGLTRYNRYSL